MRGGTGNGPRLTIGSTGELTGASDAATHGRLASGSRSPTGESPGIRNRCCPRSIHKPVCHSGPLLADAALQRQHVADGSVQTALEDAAHALALDRVFQMIVDRIDVDRQAGARAADSTSGSSNAGLAYSGSTPSRRASVSRKALRLERTELVGRDRRAPAARGRATARRRRCASSRSAPSAAVVRRDTICPARNAAGRRGRDARAGGRADARPAGAFSAPSAAVFHSSPSMSSIETKVGSPPMVSRTSPRSISSST